jgi:steroid delta-isomerase
MASTGLQSRVARRRVLPLLTAAVLLPLAAPAQDEARIAGPRAGNINDQILMHWLEAYGAAWESKDAAAAAALFAENASYQETPYAEPFVGRAAIRDYWAEVTADQSGIEFESAIVAISGMTGVARWSAKFESAEAPVELNGIFVLEFEADGTVASLREWWHAR